MSRGLSTGMDLVYAIPGSVALIEWLLAAALYAIAWRRMKPGLNRFGDALAVAGLVTALGGAAWLVWAGTLNPALIRSSLATGWAVSALVVYAVLAHRRQERLSALAVLVFAILLQVLAVAGLLSQWGAEAPLPEVFLPLWTALRTLTGLVGYGGLAMSAMLILLSFTLTRIQHRLSVEHLTAAIGLPALEWQAWQIALVALGLSLSIGLIRSWWGLGLVILGGIPWALITWLLLAASAYGFIQGAAHRRTARALLVLACAVGIVSVLSLSGPLAEAGVTSYIQP
jgi:hypothetical protein